VKSNLADILSYVRASLDTIIVQKYIDRPLLYNKRKFDIRMYSLVTWVAGHVQVYFSELGYVRTSTYPFSLDNLEDTLIHLTNEAVQVNSEDFGKYEKGNKLTLEALEEYIRENVSDKFAMKDVTSKMKVSSSDPAIHRLRGSVGDTPAEPERQQVRVRAPRTRLHARSGYETLLD
jgi:hypothetical protein